VQCHNCGVTSESGDKFKVKYNGVVSCLVCYIKEQKSFLSFCNYWKRKVTSEHGIRNLDKIIQETESEIANTEKTLRHILARQKKKQ
jgi:hypothetical protein